MKFSPKTTSSDSAVLLIRDLHPLKQMELTVMALTARWATELQVQVNPRELMETWPQSRAKKLSKKLLLYSDSILT